MLEEPLHNRRHRVEVGNAAALDRLPDGLRIEQLYVDSHGVTEPVAAVCHLLGIRLAPRIANLRDKRLWLSEGMKRRA